jgi:hypothetical protein
MLSSYFPFNEATVLLIATLVIHKFGIHRNRPLPNSKPATEGQNRPAIRRVLAEWATRDLKAGPLSEFMGTLYWV